LLPHFGHCGFATSCSEIVSVRSNVFPLAVGVAHFKPTGDFLYGTAGRGARSLHEITARKASAEANGRSVDPTEQRAIRRCGLGALIAAAHEITNDHRRAHDLAITALRPLHGSTALVKINDIRGHSAVLALFDEVIAV
jgi:hypothetical protein